MDHEPPAHTGERTIRVFISSTFRDMHAERDVLNRVVFPELRKRCQQRGAEFIGVDLRWGVTEDEAQGAGALAVCLDEIERCRPFFVCLLGDRFGWVPPPEEIAAPLFDTTLASGAMPSLAVESYQRDDTVEPAVYRLRRDAGRRIPAQEADALARFWETRGLEGAGDSITAREILRGVFDADYPPTHALFYLRTAGVERDSAFPPSFVPVFVEPDEGRRRKLDALKARIRGASDRMVVREYDVHYGGLTIDAALLPGDLSPDDRAALDDGVVTPDEWPRVSADGRQAIEQHGTVALTEMDALAERVLDDLWRAIEPELARPSALDAHQRERAYHDRFVTRHTEFFHGREAERALVVSYVANGDDRELLVVTGEPGSGKSAFMATCVRDCRELHPEALVIPHFIGTSPDSASLPATLRSLCETLRREADLDEAVAEDPDKLRFQLRMFLEQAGARRPVILFLDALNQLDPSGRSHELDWLPVWVPPGTRIVVSTVAGDCLDQLNRRVPLDHVVTIPALPVDERRTLTTDFLARRRKTLTTDQLNALLDVEKRPDAGLPLYTLVALEELCLFGDYALLRNRIDSLPPTLPELFQQVLARLEHDHTRATVEAVCAWLAVARSGLLESEVVDLLGTGGAFPRIRWTRFYRALEPYLKPIEEDSEERTGGHLDFYHDQIRSAAYWRYLHMAAPDADATDRYRESHRHLAEYFRSVAHDETVPNKWRSDRVRGLSELPFHQTLGEMWEGLEATLCDLDFIAAKSAAGLTYELVKDYDAALAALPEGRAAREQEKERDKGLARYTGELVEYAHQWSEARDRHVHDPVGCPLPDPTQIPAPAPPPKERMWTEEEIEADTERITTMPERIDRIRAFGQFVNAESHHLAQFGAQPGFCVQQAHNAAATGPVARAAEARVGSSHDPAAVLLLCPSAQRPAWNAHPACERTLAGHTDLAMAVAVMPDGRRAVSGSQDYTLRVWDLASGACERTLTGHTKTVFAVPVTPDGRRAVSGSADRTLRVWNLASGACERTLAGHTDLVMAVAVTPDGRRAVSGSWDQTLRVWDLATGVCEQTLTGHTGWVCDLGVTPDGGRAVSGSWDHTLRVWDLATGACEWKLAGHTDSVYAVAVTPDGRRAVSGSGDQTLRVWDLATGVCERTLVGHAVSVSAVAVTADGRRAVSGSLDRTLRVWDLVTGACERTLVGGHFDEAVAVTADGRYAVSASEHLSLLQVWNLASGAGERTLAGSSDKAVAVTADGRYAVSASEHLRLLERTLAGHTRRVEAVAATPDGRRAVSGSMDGTLRVWDLMTGACKRKLEGHTDEVKAVAVTPDGRRAVSGSLDHTLRVWNLASGACERALTGHTSFIDAVAVTSDGRRAVSRSWDHTLRVWNLATGACEWTLAEYADSVEAMAVTPDGRRAVSGGRDGTLRVWDLATGTCQQTMTGDTHGLQAVAVTPDGRRAVSASGPGTLRVWDLATGACERTLAERAVSVVALAVTPDGRRAVSAGVYGTLRVWDLATGTGEQTLTGHTEKVQTVAVTLDGRLAVSGSRDQTLRVWDLATGVCVAVVPNDSGVTATVAFSRGVVFGTIAGPVGVRHPMPPLLLAPPLVTPTRLWWFAETWRRRFKRIVGHPAGHWDDRLTVACAWCGHRFPVDPPVPASAGTDIRCPSTDCGQPLRLTPFVCDPRESGWE